MPNESNSLATKKYIYIYIILKNEKFNQPNCICSIGLGLLWI